MARAGPLGHQAPAFLPAGEPFDARVLMDGVPINEPAPTNFASQLAFELVLAGELNQCSRPLVDDLRARVLERRLRQARRERSFDS